MKVIVEMHCRYFCCDIKRPELIKKTFIDVGYTRLNINL